MCAKFQLMPKIKIQLLKISQGTYIEVFAKFEFNEVRLRWFSQQWSQSILFLLLQLGLNIKMCAKFKLVQKIKILLQKISQGTYIDFFAKFEFNQVRLRWFSQLWSQSILFLLVVSCQLVSQLLVVIFQLSIQPTRPKLG